MRSGSVPLFQLDLVIYTADAPTRITCNLFNQVVIIICFPDSKVFPCYKFLILFADTVIVRHVCIKVKLDVGNII